MSETYEEIIAYSGYAETQSLSCLTFCSVSRKYDSPFEMLQALRSAFIDIANEQIDKERGCCIAKFSTGEKYCSSCGRYLDDLKYGYRVIQIDEVQSIFDELGTSNVDSCSRLLKEFLHRGWTVGTPPQEAIVIFCFDNFLETGSGFYIADGEETRYIDHSISENHNNNREEE